MRVLLKISGEALMGSESSGVDAGALRRSLSFKKAVLKSLLCLVVVIFSVALVVKSS